MILRHSVARKREADKRREIGLGRGAARSVEGGLWLGAYMIPGE